MYDTLTFRTNRSKSGSRDGPDIFFSSFSTPQVTSHSSTTPCGTPTTRKDTGDISLSLPSYKGSGPWITPFTNLSTNVSTHSQRISNPDPPVPGQTLRVTLLKLPPPDPVSGKRLSSHLCSPPTDSFDVQLLSLGEPTLKTFLRSDLSRSFPRPSC